MDICIVHNWKEIPVESLTWKDLDTIERSLMLENPTWRKQQALGYSTYKTPRYIKCWGRRDGLVLVPRHFGNSKFGNKPEYLDYPVQWPTTKWTPRKHQIEPLKRLQKDKEGVLILPCGAGKSIVALFHLQFLNQRALILVPSRTLLKQWQSYLKDMFPSIKRGDVREANSRNWKAGRLLTVATYQQVSLHPLPKEFYNQFGVVVYDEVDVANAIQLSKALPKFNSLRLGLTATKHRDDGMDVLSDLHIGPTIFAMTKMADSVHPTVFVKYTNINLDLNEPTPKAITTASDSPIKEDIVLDLTRRALEKGRKTFVLCERVAQAEAYYARAKKEGQDASLAHAKLKESERDFGGQVIFATAMLGRGFNDEDLDTLIVTGLFSYSVREFRQLLGRVQRVKEGKKNVIVIILQDHHPSLNRKIQKIIQGTKDLYKEVKYL